MKEFLYFNEMLTPKVITVVYWLLLIGVVLGGLGAMIAGQFLAGLGGIIFGLIGVRIWCELLIVLFKMNEALQDMRNK